MRRLRSPVERFMQEALYHPRHGYYSPSGCARWAGGGLFHVRHAAPGAGAGGRGVGGAPSRRRCARGRWHLIELGGGSGQLAAEILRTLGLVARGVGLRYHLVEISATLRDRHSSSGCDGWREACDGIRTSARRSTPPAGRALIFSNEFVDAFPCVQLARDATAGRWREVCVAWPEGSEHPVEVLREWSLPRTVPICRPRLR